MIEMRAGFAIDQGPRDSQQDNALTGPNFAVIADGVSNSSDSGVAAAMAVDTYATVARVSDSGELLDGLLAAPALVMERLSDIGNQGLTTVAAAILDARHNLWLTHAGDSQILLFRDKRIVYMSVPHDETADRLMRGGKILAGTDGTARLTRFIGARYAPDDPTITVNTARPGDTVVLTTDGIHTLVTPDEMLAAVEFGRSAVNTAEVILNSARRSGLSDNATCAVAQIRRLRIPTETVDA